MIITKRVNSIDTEVEISNTNLDSLISEAYNYLNAKYRVDIIEKEGSKDIIQLYIDKTLFDEYNKVFLKIVLDSPSNAKSHSLYTAKLINECEKVDQGISRITLYQNNGVKLLLQCKN